MREIQALPRYKEYSEYSYLTANFQLAAYDEPIHCPVLCRDVFGEQSRFALTAHTTKIEVDLRDWKNRSNFIKYIEETGMFQMIISFRKDVKDKSNDIATVLNYLEKVYGLKTSTIEQISFGIGEITREGVSDFIKLQNNFGKENNTNSYLLTLDKWFIKYFHRFSLLNMLLRNCDLETINDNNLQEVVDIIYRTCGIFAEREEQNKRCNEYIIRYLKGEEKELFEDLTIYPVTDTVANLLPLGKSVCVWGFKNTIQQLLKQ
jgi:hypothetical protein